ncbi:nickel pincer cofactor biosynthesis protein LarC [Ornithinimicrobium cerasi]|uniref:Pyridinium-3,5-bisthiocarboxylic acid mononucleotide nickel insertion protein n=1 Tax=Ornithinimicrobium cerasi TaxID=2248773 RepID=A0A285VMI8_9MICO|nr:nickel pincer cofactor biosynthesis protein LarC [Ornithinimicrobium cerasi]SOC55107.1 hypothetical protein SAMN05421879_104164 [Ornithinimicrobium cerasi]
MTRTAWVDASAGVAGDMLLAALLDAGADLASVRSAVAAVLPGEVELRTEPVLRAGQSALRVLVGATGMPPERTWADLRARLVAADLDPRVRALALPAFELLAEVEATVHGVAVEQVHFHEVGAWDSVADLVGVCAAVVDLGVDRVTCGQIGLGSGSVRTQHGLMAVPVPAVLGVLAASGLPVAADDGLAGECATPTGVALLAVLVESPAPGPVGRVLGVGVGAGTRDTRGRANVTRVVLCSPVGGGGREGGDLPVESLVEVAATVDDLDPRVWPEVVAALLARGALDAWTAPVLMKKGRPGTVVTALVAPGDRPAVVDVLLAHTSTLGVRWHEVRRAALHRSWRDLDVLGDTVRVKLGHRGGRIVSATPELEDCRALASRTGTPLRVVLRLAEAQAQSAGWGPGAAI